MKYRKPGRPWTPGRPRTHTGQGSSTQKHTTLPQKIIDLNLNQQFPRETPRNSTKRPGPMCVQRHPRLSKATPAQSTIGPGQSVFKNRLPFVPTNIKFIIVHINVIYEPFMKEKHF